MQIAASGPRESGPPERVVERCRREVLKMARNVQVIPFLLCERESGGTSVRDLDDKPAVRLQNPANLGQLGKRIGNMLEDVPQRDGVEEVFWEAGLCQVPAISPDST